MPTRSRRSDQSDAANSVLVIVHFKMCLGLSLQFELRGCWPWSQFVLNACLLEKIAKTEGNTKVSGGVEVVESNRGAA